MIVMFGNSTGWFCHCLARETGKLGHIYSPGQQRGPWPWFPFALDNGAFGFWNQKANAFDEEAWQSRGFAAWQRLLFWSKAQSQTPQWAVVPDRPGDWEETKSKWARYYQLVVSAEIPLALAVQDGATSAEVLALEPKPDVICVGGTTAWKWATAENWIKTFARVHILRCNAPAKLHWLEGLGCESVDGSGWNRGDRTQTKGLEIWARGITNQTIYPLWPHVCREIEKDQLTFA